MSSTDPAPNQGGNQVPDPYRDWRGGRPSRLAARMERRAQRRAARGGGGAWVGGAVLIAVGVLLLVQNQAGSDLGVWWALLILIPAAGAFVAAGRAFSVGGALTRTVWREAVVGIFLTVLTAGIIFNTPFLWSWLFPALLIAVGAGLLVSMALPE